MDTTQDNQVKANIQLSSSATIPTTGVKNISVGFPNQPGVITAVGADDTPTIEGNYITAAGVKLQLTSDGVYSNTLSAGASDTVVATLSNSDDLRLFAMPAVTLYDTTPSDANKIPDGSSVNPNNWEFSMWIDWGDSNNNNVVHKTFIKNTSVGSRTFHYRINFRFMLEAAEF